ncbi:MAG TPA: competence/damage-inducible protein A [Cytophagaceae bacterium]|jgi:nicotinamide-nucleotide amidase|nr:competence/damage-inducible protein A [Cytophagaceae bacterium]
MMEKILADIITIGDEILYGQIIDTNSQWISTELDKIGVSVFRKTAVGDNKEEILKILKESEQRSDIILITGGLGPTSDDITKPALAEYFNSKLVLNQEALEDVTKFFKSKGKDLSELNRQQAFLPDVCRFISNKSGTAPGMWFEKNGKILISMPGVPFEMKAMMQQEVLPKITQKFTMPVILHKMVKIVGIGESYLSEKIADWEHNLTSDIKLAYLPHLGEITLRLTATGADKEELRLQLDKEVMKLRGIIPNYIFGIDDDVLAKVVGAMLLKNKLSISSAESCTGGYLAYMLTTIPGSSEYYWGSVVAYQNVVKTNILGVEEQTINEYGAVSEQTVKEMAEGVRKKFGTDIGISSSGIAGPTGGTEEKPVGTVWIGYSDKNQTFGKKLMLGNDRDINVKLTCIAIFNMIRQTLGS